MLAETLAAEADFLSIGTNDLTQYALAADRGNAAVSAKVDALHPAVLRLIRLAADGARKHSRWIGVCGGLASDPLAAGILFGLGVTELSVAPAAVATIKATVRRLRTDYCRKLATRACAAASAQEIRTMAAEAFGAMFRVERLQPLGRALMLPIAVLPIAALLLRLGQAGHARYSVRCGSGQRHLLQPRTAVRGGCGGRPCPREPWRGGARRGRRLCRCDRRGESAAEAAARYRSARRTSSRRPGERKRSQSSACRPESSPESSRESSTTASSTSNCPTISLSSAAAASFRLQRALRGIVGAVLFGFGFPWFEAAVDTLSRWVVSAGPIGLFLYGLLNRLLLVTGLHHILNNIAWFLLGDFHGATGDLKRFFAGDPTAGGFMAGFFPVMMFGLPAACLAMYRNALPERRKAVGGLLLSVALTSLLTGVTEPIEFLFIFLAPLLFAAARGPDRPVDGDHGRAGREARLRLFRRPVRLCAELRPRHPAAAPAPGRGCLFRRLLCDLQLVHPPFQPGDAGPRTGGRADGIGASVSGRRRTRGPIRRCSRR